MDNEPKHPNNMNEQELRELVRSMSYMALDLAQHLDFTNSMLKVQYRKEAYERAVEMAWQICYAHKYKNESEGNCTIALFDKKGLTVNRCDFGELINGENMPTLVYELPPEEYSEFEQAFLEIEDIGMSEDDIIDKEKELRYWREITDEKNNKDRVDVKVKSLRKMMFSMQYILDLSKACNKVVSMLRNEIDYKKA